MIHFCADPGPYDDDDGIQPRVRADHLSNRRFHDQCDYADLSLYPDRNRHGEDL